MNYVFYLKPAKNYFNKNINNSDLINELNIKANLNIFYTIQNFNQVYEYKYCIVMDQYCEYTTNSYLFWDLFDICKIFFKITLKDHIIPNNFMYDYTESNILGNNFISEYTEQLKNKLFGIYKDNVIFTRDFLGDIHISLKMNSLQNHNIYLIGINNKYILFTNDSLPKILEQISSKTCLLELREKK